MAAVHDLALLDTAAEPRFDRLTELVAMLLDVPIALITLVDRDRQWFKSRVGLETPEMPRDIGFCAHAIVSEEAGPFMVEDALLDERFADNPLVTDDPHIRFYAAQPLRDRHGLPVGTVCVIDRQPRELSSSHQRALVHIADLVEQEFHRKSERSLLAELEQSEERKSLILDTITEGVVLQDSRGRIIEWNAAAERLLGLSAGELGGDMPIDARFGSTRIDGSSWPSATHPAMVALRTREPVLGEVMGVQQPNGGHVWLRLDARPTIDEHGETRQVVTTFVDVTTEIDESHQRHILEEALRRSEETARVSLDALEQGVVLADHSGAILRVNPAAERILGYSAQQLSDRWNDGRWESFDEDGVLLSFRDRPMVRATLTGQSVVGQTVGWRRSDGTRIVVRVSVVPNVDDAGGMLVAFTDVTEEHLARKLLDTTLEIAPVGLAVLDADRLIMRCNRTFAVHAGRSAEELIGTDVLDLIDHDDRPSATAMQNEVRRGEGATGELDQRILRPDGTELWVTSRLAVIPDLERPLAVAATFDITESKRMMAELARFSHLFHHANDIITVIDADGHVLHTSPSNERILGYPATFRHPEGFVGIVHPDDRPLAAREIQKLTADRRQPLPFTMRVIANDGSVRHLECIGVNLLAEPAVRGIVITGRDVTERVHLTEQVAHRALHDPLTELANRQLLESSIDTALTRRSRNPSNIALCFIDLDGFKSVNDTFGHAAGDTLLVSVAEKIREAIREGDLAARVGGDEFVIMLDPVTDAAQALVVANRVRDRLVADHDSAGHPLGDEPSCGASIGVAVSRRGDSVSSLLNRADAAMYRAKALGKSSVELAV